MIKTEAVQASTGPSSHSKHEERMALSGRAGLGGGAQSSSSSLWACRWHTKPKPVLNFKLTQRFFKAGGGKHRWDVRMLL